MIHIYADRTKKGEEHEAGRRLLKAGLKEQFGVEVREEEIGRSGKGKPYLKKQPGIFFNISHSGEFAVCALAHAPLGVDIERHREIRFERVGRKFLTEEEWKIWEKSSDAQRYFFDQWVKREAYLKWKGTGIDRDLRTLEFDGFGEFFPLADNYSAAVWTEKPACLCLHFLF
ncbi:MAG: 4'-phosphopantetheinyl transferase family protein [Ruminococcus sp.]|jgi:4'-phosphopantetheinyl transferase